MRTRILIAAVAAVTLVPPATAGSASAYGFNSAIADAAVDSCSGEFDRWAAEKSKGWAPRMIEIDRRYVASMLSKVLGLALAESDAELDANIAKGREWENNYRQRGDLDGALSNRASTCLRESIRASRKKGAPAVAANQAAPTPRAPAAPPPDSRPAYRPEEGGVFNAKPAPADWPRCEVRPGCATPRNDSCEGHGGAIGGTCPNGLLTGLARVTGPGGIKFVTDWRHGLHGEMMLFAQPSGQILAMVNGVSSTCIGNTPEQLANSSPGCRQVASELGVPAFSLLLNGQVPSPTTTPAASQSVTAIPTTPPQAQAAPIAAAAPKSPPKAAPAPHLSDDQLVLAEMLRQQKEKRDQELATYKAHLKEQASRSDALAVTATPTASGPNFRIINNTDISLNFTITYTFLEEGVVQSHQPISFVVTPFATLFLPIPYDNNKAARWEVRDVHTRWWSTYQ